MQTYNRRKSIPVKVGNIIIGGDAPVRVQTMANTNTNDIESSVAQAIIAIEAGAELVRFTAQGVAEAESLRLIHSELRQRGYSTPLVADIHFNPAAAEVAAQYVEKVRINPGNFVKSIKAEQRREAKGWLKLLTTQNRSLNRNGFCCAKNLCIFSKFAKNTTPQFVSA
jgi:(E)-4-hydroxy-3-methylbut-2-enyl-diphosphate synthase